MNIENKIVMVTGAGGSIGSELCRQIVTIKPKLLIMYDLSEYALYNIEKELQSKLESVEVLSILGSVNNRNRLTQILTKFNVHTIYHAAAYKHVPLVEHNIIEAIRNNVFGTKSIGEMAIKSKVENFIFCAQTGKYVVPGYVHAQSPADSDGVISFLSRAADPGAFCLLKPSSLRLQCARTN